MEDGIRQVVHVNAGPDDHVAVELPVLLKVDPTNVILGKLMLTVVGHRDGHVHNAFLQPAIPIAIHIVVGARAPEALPG